MTDLEAKKLLLSCPGDTIQETIDEKGMSQRELADRLGRSIPKINELIKGKAPITKDTAIRLERVLGISASFWLNLEQRYQEEVLEIQKMESLQNAQEWAYNFPISYLKNQGYLPNTTDKSTITEELIKFFGIGAPEQWNEIYKVGSLAFKIELRHAAEPEAISVWLRIGELQAQRLTINEFDKSLIRSRLDEIQKLCFEAPINWLNKLQQICAECGIALVYTPSVPKAPIYGVARWIRSNTLPLIQLTDRRKDYNSFWFSFYHELGHILLHGKKDVFIEGVESISPNIEKEKEADDFAISKLFSEKHQTEVFKHSTFDEKLILSISKKIKIHPSILVSQIQRRNESLYKDFSLNSLKQIQKVNFEDLDKF